MAWFFVAKDSFHSIVDQPTLIRFSFTFYRQTTGKFQPVFLPVMFAAEVGCC